MSKETVLILKEISISGYIVSLLFMAISVFLFFKYKINVIIGEMSGITVQKQIKEIREKNNFVQKTDSYEKLQKNVVTTFLDDKDMETTILSKDFECVEDNYDATMILYDAKENFTIEKSVEIIHTSEIIAL